MINLKSSFAGPEFWKKANSSRYCLQINKRGDVLDEKIRKLEAELVKYRDQIKRTRPGPPQEAIKARAMRVLKQKKM